MDARPELTGRCTVVVAAAGYGKTEAVRRWLRTVEARWQTDAVAIEIGAAWVVIDDAAGLRGEDLRAMLAHITSQPSARVVLVSRWPLTLPTGPRHRSLVEERGPADLAFTVVEVAEIMRQDYGLVDRDLAAALHDLTAGWPALVRLAGEHLATVGDLAAAELATVDLATQVGGPGTSVAAFLDKHVLTPQSRAAGHLVRDLAHLGTIDEDLCRALGHRRAEQTIAQLTRIGLIVAGRDPSSRRLVPLVREAARERWPLSGDDRARLFGTAADWYAANQRVPEAIEAYRLAGQSSSCGRLLREHGPAWVNAGGATTISAAIAALAPEDRGPEIRLLLGEAMLVLGEDDRALAELTALAGDGGDLPAGLAWRIGAVHYQRGDPHSASAAFARGRIDAQASADEAMLLAGSATARWMAGDPTSCGDLAQRALLAADRAGDDRARSAAHVALAMHAMLAGDRAGNAAYYERALHYAEAARDHVQAARIHTNHSARLLEEAHYQEALVQARQAKALAEATGCSAILAIAACNEAEALHRLGRPEEATACYTLALGVFQRRRSNKVAYPLIGLGAIHRLRGRRGLARAAYEEAARAATATGDIQALAPALAGLARVLADTDPAAAADQAALALQAASGPFVTEAMLANGWAQLGAGHRPAAQRCAVEASTHARRHRDSRGLAEALELRAAATVDLADMRHCLCEAAETWRLAGATLDLDRVVVALGTLPDASVAERVGARLARERLAAAGVALPTALPANGGVARDPASSVVIRSLGRFEVLVADSVVSMSMWQSRKARDLLRILVARRGRAIARDELTEVLWPGGDPERLAHRLSVALSTVRSVLDPDRTKDADHFVLADRSGVALEVANLTVDLEVFLGEVAHGLALRDRGLGGDARAALAAAERRYTGDFLENEPYEDWSVAAREEARATYLRTARALAELFRQADRVDDAVHYLLKVLDKDPYDERGHRELVQTLAVAGRHGESRRAQARYVAAMQEIGVAASL